MVTYILILLSYIKIPPRVKFQLKFQKNKKTKSNLCWCISHTIWVSRYTFRDGNPGVLIFTPLSMGSTLKEKNLLPMSKFFPLRVNPILEGFSVPGKQQKDTKVVSLCKHGYKTWKCTYTNQVLNNQGSLDQESSYMILHC